MAESLELCTPPRQHSGTAFTSSTNRGRQPGNWSKIAAVVSVFQLFEDREEATLGYVSFASLRTFFRPGELHMIESVEAVLAVPHLLFLWLDAKAGDWCDLIFSPTCSPSNSHYHTSELRREKGNRAPRKTDEGE